MAAGIGVERIAKLSFEAGAEEIQVIEQDRDAKTPAWVLVLIGLDLACL